MVSRWGACPQAAGTAARGLACHGPSLDGLHVVGRVQADLPTVQASFAPALFILILYFGQLIACKMKESGSKLEGGRCWLQAELRAL